MDFIFYLFGFFYFIFVFHFLLLRITEEDTSEENKTIEIVSNNISRAQMLATLVETKTVSEIVILKRIVLDLGQFDRN